MTTKQYNNITQTGTSSPLGGNEGGSVRVGILGAAGYTGGELLRLLLGHPRAEIVFANSESNAGNPVADVHEGLYGDTDLRFTGAMPFEDVDVLFFCFGHGKSRQFLQEHHVPDDVRIIDLAQDFRLAAEGNDFVYGLPTPAASPRAYSSACCPPQGWACSPKTYRSTPLRAAPGRVRSPGRRPTSAGAPPT